MLKVITMFFVIITNIFANVHNNIDKELETFFMHENHNKIKEIVINIKEEEITMETGILLQDFLTAYFNKYYEQKQKYKEIIGNIKNSTSIKYIINDSINKNPYEILEYYDNSVSKIGKYLRFFFATGDINYIKDLKIYINQNKTNRVLYNEGNYMIQELLLKYPQIRKGVN